MEYHLIPQCKGLTRTHDMNDFTLFGLMSVKVNDVGQTIETVYISDNHDGVLAEEITPVETLTRNGVTLKAYDARSIPDGAYATGTIYGCLVPYVQPHDNAPGLHVVTYEYMSSTMGLELASAVVTRNDISHHDTGFTPITPTLIPDIGQLFNLSLSTPATFARNIGQLSNLLTSVNSLHGNCFAIVGGHTSITEYLKLSTLEDVAYRPIPTDEPHMVNSYGHKGSLMAKVIYSAMMPDLKVSRSVAGRRKSPTTLGVDSALVTAIGNKQHMSWALTDTVLKHIEVPDVIEWLKKPLTSDEELSINRLSVAFNASWFEMYNTELYPDAFRIYVMTSDNTPSGLFKRKQ